MKNQVKKPFSRDILVIDDIEAECNRIVTNLRDSVFNRLNRMGGVIGISGGIDSSVTMALAAKALGADKMLAIMLPEHDSSRDSATFAQKLADKFGVEAITENITDALDGLRCYRRRDEAVKSVFPEYDSSLYKMKIGIRNSGSSSSLPPLFSVTIVDMNGHEQSRRVPAPELRQIEAASNLKQRSRMAMLYYHAERLHYAVIGTPNKHEVEQGFFVKNGDGGADVMPISHLFKTQVYQMAHYLGIPEEIIERTPTSDTYSAEQTQEEFFFKVPFKILDKIWFMWEKGVKPEEISRTLKMEKEFVEGVIIDIRNKIRTTEYLRMEPLTLT